MEIKSLHRDEHRRLRVAAYARISNDKEVLETSLAEQINRYTSLILSNPNWEFAGIYPDDGKSGTTLANRTEFMRMINNAKLGLIDIILVKSISRFARNLLDLLVLIRELRLLGIEIYFEEQEISSLDDKADQMITICAKFAEEEALAVSTNVKWRFDKNKKEGKYYFPANLYGYKTVNGTITIIEEHAKWIRYIYKRCLEGCGATLIVKELNELGSKPSHGDKWCNASVLAILRNEKYVGDCIIQKTYVENPLTHRKKFNRGEQDRVLVRNGHPAIVDRETWNKTQEVLNERGRRFRVLDHDVVKNNSDYTGFIVCGHCHSNYSLKTNRHLTLDGLSIKNFLTCGRNRITKLCDSDNIPLDQFQEGIIKMINKIKANIPYVRELLISKFGEDNKKGSDEIDELIHKIANLRTKLKRHENKIDDYSINVSKAIKDEIKELTNRKVALQNDKLIASSATARADEFITKINKLPYKVTSFDEFNFREVFDRAFVISKTAVLLVIGNSDVSNLNLSSKGDLKVEVKYRIRITDYKMNFYIYINK